MRILTGKFVQSVGSKKIQAVLCFVKIEINLTVGVEVAVINKVRTMAILIYGEKITQSCARKKLSGRLKKYNISHDQYMNMCSAQAGRCLICKTEYPDLSIDHDHATGKIRGLLCRYCNSALGFAKDDIDILLNAIIYLQVKR